MVCNVCGNRVFRNSEYRVSGACKAPALDCAACGALNLSEEAATSTEERESVKVAIAVRSGIEEHPPVELEARPLN
jgi:hypothetical protein